MLLQSPSDGQRNADAGHRDEVVSACMPNALRKCISDPCRKPDVDLHTGRASISEFTPSIRPVLDAPDASRDLWVNAARQAVSIL
jgi:hypothetical protein